ncbi:hypothetical protein [Gordonia terrae]
MTETELPLIDDPAAPWNRDTVSSAFAQSELGLTLSLYRDDRGWMTYDELCQLVCDEAASVPAEEAGWRDGEFNAHEYIIEACLVGLYDTTNVYARIVTDYTDGKYRCSADALRTRIYVSQNSDNLTFDEWLSATVTAGRYRPVEFLQYLGNEYTDGDESSDQVVHERRIVD